MSELLPRSEVDAFFADRSEDVRQLALACRDVVLDVFPDAIETAEGAEIGYGFDRGYRGLVFTISPTRDRVTLGVVDGASLPDPAGLLEGTGKRHRHVKVHDAAGLDDRLRDVLRRALARRRQQDVTG